MIMNVGGGFRCGAWVIRGGQWRGGIYRGVGSGDEGVFLPGDKGIRGWRGKGNDRQRILEIFLRVEG